MGTASTALAKSNVTLPMSYGSGLISHLNFQKSLVLQAKRCASGTASSQRWQNRQQQDRFARDARSQGLKSRAAFKLLQINERYNILRPGQTVVDLGYAPGSWSQVAIRSVGPKGHVIGIDLIPAQSPEGNITTITGDFLDPIVQSRLRQHLQMVANGQLYHNASQGYQACGDSLPPPANTTSTSLIEDVDWTGGFIAGRPSPGRDNQRPAVHTCDSDDTIDVVLSDMMMNTSGNSFRDHVKSMDLCDAALHFAFRTLKVGGSFICKFYQGAEDKNLEQQLKKLFTKVIREKPESSRSASKEAFLVGLKRKRDIRQDAVWPADH